MAKKSSASSRPEKLVRTTSAAIRSKPLSPGDRATLERIAREQAAADYGEIPDMTDKQLAGMIRFRERHPKVAVSVRLEPKVLEWLKSKGPGHLTRINDILANLMEAEARHNTR